jgi:hypothetical protein
VEARLSKLGSLTVEQIKGVDFGPLFPQAAVHPKGIQHTTEGGFESSLSILRVRDSPHFLLGRDNTGRVRCIQLVPLGHCAGAVEHPDGTPPTNGIATVQVELVGFSKRTLWLPDPGVTEALAHLYAAVNTACKIPLKHVANPKRDRIVWADGTGWFGHADVADQPLGHWDPGLLDYKTLFVAAQKLLTEPAWYKAALAQTPMWAWITWKDNGEPADLRPPQIPVKVPASWWVRYRLHLGT